MLQDITHNAPRSKPLVRIYDSQLAFNRAASALLGLDIKSSVSFKIEKDNVSNHVFVGRQFASAYSHKVYPVGQTYRVRNAHLCKVLAQLLGGKGTYCIEEDIYKMENFGQKYYSIFKVRYD